MLFKLAFKELAFDRMMSACQVAAIACILAPLLLLFSLRNGILQEMESKLLNDPHVLSLTLDTSYRLDKDFFERLEQREDVGFVVPEITALNAIVDLKFPGGANRVSVMATKAGDPIVCGSNLDGNYELATNEGYLTNSLAMSRDVHVGDQVEMRVTRVINGERQVAVFHVTIKGLIADRFVKDDYLLLNPETINAVDDYRNGYEPKILSDGSNVKTAERQYAKFRLYAKDLNSVIPLYNHLVEQHLDVSSKVRQIEDLQAIDRVLNFVFSVIASVSVVGGALAVGGLLLSSLKARKRNLVLLRLMGQNQGGIYLQVLIECFLIGTLGFLLALALYWGGSYFVNDYFKIMMPGMAISVLTYEHFLIFYLCTLVLTEITAIFATQRVCLRVHIADILREA